MNIAPMKILLILSLLPFAGSAFSQNDFERYLREQSKGVAGLESEFRNYREQQDAEFAGFLKTGWRTLNAEAERARMTAPEPRTAPVFRAPEKPESDVRRSQSSDKPVSGPRKPQAPVQPGPGVDKPAAPAATRPDKPAPDASATPVPDRAATPAPTPESPLRTPVLDLLFYGNRITVPVDRRWPDWRMPTGDKPEAMSAFWSFMSTSDYAPTLTAVQNTRRQLQLDDWATVSLLRDAVQSIHPASADQQKLLLWFLLVKTGFDVRMAYSGEDIYLLLAVQETVFESPRIVLDGKTYYPVLAEQFGRGMRSFYTHEARYPGPLKPVRLDAIRIGFAGIQKGQRTLRFSFDNKPVTLDASFNAAIIPYLNRVPTLDFAAYFRSDASAPLQQELLPELRRRTEKMPDAQAVQFLLSLVQQAFDYRTTLEQFGRDKAFFVDDVLYFPYSDCKARAVAFAWLVRQVRGLEVVGLHYPNHLTTAVALKEKNPDWVTIEHRGRSFVYADPTFIGAPVGKQQREYQGVKPIAVIEFTPPAPRP